MARYFIEENIYNEVVEPKLKRIGKKCAKNGNAFAHTIIGTSVKGVNREGKIVEDEKEIRKYYTFLEIEVEGIAQVGEYDVVAMLEYNPNGNIVKPLHNLDADVPQRFWHSDCTCDHCKTNRSRNKMFVVKNIETDEYSQVGGSCLREFTGRLDAGAVSAMYDSIAELAEYSGFCGIGHSEPLYDVVKVIEIATAIINKIGYFPSISSMPTKYLTIKALDEKEDCCKATVLNKELREARFEERFDEEDFRATKQTAIEIVNYYLSLEQEDSFTHNIKTFLEIGYVKMKDIGYIAYLPQGYAKYLEKEKERAKRVADDSTSDYFGEVGKRYRSVKFVTFSMITSYETMYGVTHIYKFKLANGEILIWKTSNFIDDEIAFELIDFTVKEHSEYNTVKQTNITRAKLH